MNEIESHDLAHGEGREENVKRGLKAYVFSPLSLLVLEVHARANNTVANSSATHNPNVTDYGKQQARSKLEGMHEHVDEPAD